MQQHASSAIKSWTGRMQPRLGALSSSTDLKMPDRGLAGVFRIEAVFRAHLGDESKILATSQQTENG